ncbi:hypothetical protein F7Q91_03390 [Vibrio chagasii]|uniref:Type 4 secretion system PilS N-terminal domain-containing protein n=1 Tax=Vibrio chagasii TaxID=170679 RepID=A0A7V7NXA7_9VIBR|nr:hypothetical protein [Vibrio chagasii]KAB0482466.1 hypothetical protein F7Q91_03390 [Vibrio chagasii]
MLFDKFKKNVSKNPDNHHRKRGGFAISGELQAVLIFLGVMVVGYATTLGDSSEDNQVTKARTALITASEKMRTTVGGFGSYTSVNNKDCYDKDIFPSDWLSATADQFTTPFTDNGLTCASADTATNKDGITTTGTGKYFTFALSGVETDQCNKLVANTFQQFVEIQVEGTRIDGNATMKTQCSSADSVTITFINR